ncbi:High-affinity branched-chain amino acid ABC transporter [Pseudomonas syringae pv. papulans]|nr:High-affinity branched-chain amino acid ABC transporter [Pseudomonas syringae pv. papulans]
MSRPLLQATGLSMRFGGLLAVNGVALTVNQGQVVSMIGPNGAGKTTVFNCLTGFYRPSAGTILLDGEPIQGLAGHQIARKSAFEHQLPVRPVQDARVPPQRT